MKKITETIEEYFDAVEASKDYYGYFYSTTEAIIIAILGTFCGLKNMKQIQKWAMDERVREFLKEYCGIIEILCYSWFTQILGIINPKSFNECFIKWALNLVGGQTKDSTISFDSKTVRSTGKMKNYAQPLHIVSGHLADAWSESSKR